MENTHFRSPWNPNPNPNRHGHRSFSRREKPKTRRSLSKPKVKPVRFVEEAVTETKRMSSAAVRIQSFLRGFLVRRKVGTVRRIEREVDEIERMIERDEASIRREEKERTRVNETLMRVLLRLDSVRGVRDYRRRVIRRVILMQEKVDSLLEAIGGQETPENREEMVEFRETLDICNSGAEEAIKEGSLVEGTMKRQETLEFSINAGSSLEELMKTQETLEFGIDDDKASLVEEMMEDQEILDICNAGAEEAIKEGSLVEGPMKCQETLEFPINVGLMKTQETLEFGVDDKASLMEEDWSVVEAPKPSAAEGCSGLRSMMERMAEENEALKGLVAELCERSALQCELMGGIMKKVEQLESTVQEMERRKKKEAKTALDSDNNKCCHKKSGQ